MDFMDGLEDMDFDVLEDFLLDQTNGNVDDGGVMPGNPTPITNTVNNVNTADEISISSFPIMGNDDSNAASQKDDLSVSAGSISRRPSRRTSSSSLTGSKVFFPSQLHEMLSQSSNGDFSSIVSWAPHGRAFLVHDTNKFVSEVLPKFFNHTKFSSFQRQLNSYGFRRVVKGRDQGAYYHANFLRGRPQDCTTISRLKQKLEPLPPNSEVQFYSLPFIGDDGQELPIVPQIPPPISMNMKQSNKAGPPLPSSSSPTNSSGNTNTEMMGGKQASKRRRRSSAMSKDDESIKAIKRESIVSADNFSIENKSSNNTNNTNNGSSSSSTNNTLINRKDISKPADIISSSSKFHLPEDKLNETLMKSNKINSKMIEHGILPISDHPLDQVTFFIPLDLLLA